jgi:putative transcriptional regulator
MDLAPGALLIAEPALLDPNFKQTVILLCEHTEEGSFGLVINRRTSLHLPEVLNEPVGLDHPLYLGGPVQPDTLHFLHLHGSAIEATVPVADGIAWGGSFDEVAAHVRTGALDPDGFRFFAGYAGWGAGQLEEEVGERSWLVGRARAEHVFAADPERLWRTLILAHGGDLALYVNYPDDPRTN